MQRAPPWLMADGQHSNGIRFSITNMEVKTSRVLPTVYQNRCDVSLYDAQYRKGVQIPLPEDVMKIVLEAMRDFQQTCDDFGVLNENIHVVATEATRNALNSEKFLEKIRAATGWTPKLLSKEAEGWLGAMGIASSISISEEIAGFVVDLGGGSAQLTWMERDQSGKITLQFSKSFPYGAAALSLFLSDVQTQPDRDYYLESVASGLQLYFEEIRTHFQSTGKQLPEDGHRLFLSGGGFRRWGHLLMTLDAVQPYPIPIVNGYAVDGEQILPKLEEKELFDVNSHRISKRGHKQLPAIRFFLQALLKAIDKPINRVTFCQGGVREGLLYEQLPGDIRAQNPCKVASQPFAPSSADRLAAILRSSIPTSGRLLVLVDAIINLLYFHGSFPKDIRASAALRCTTSGVLTDAHGLSHYDRAMLALILCERWGGDDDIPATDLPFLHSLRGLYSQKAAFWAKYIGRMAKHIATIYPAGLVRHHHAVTTSWSHVSPSAATTTIGNGNSSGNGSGSRGQKKNGSPAGTVAKLTIELTVCRTEFRERVQNWAHDIRKLAKKADQWGDGKHDHWLEMDVKVVEEFTL